jgi:chemotaxis protein methyltransferase CheR
MLKPAAEPRMSDEEFRLLCAAIRDHCGLDFTPETRSLLQRRLAPRLVELHIRSFTEYYLYLRYTADRRSELDEVADLVTTNETYFFRERYQLDAFQSEILDEFSRNPPRPRRLHVWSAGCSTGEEAYTIAMLIHETGRFDGWDVQVFANDISRTALAAARRGLYGSHSLRATDELYQRAYLPGADGHYAVRRDIKEMVTFAQVNLIDHDSLAALGEMDVIFCRNVLIYFDEPARRKAVEAFHRKLARRGYLLLGHAESLMNLSTAFELVHLERDMVYRKP